MQSQDDKGEQDDAQSQVTTPRNRSELNEAQYNFVEAREPSELIMCLILASAYLGLAKYCWAPLLLAKNWKLLINVEGFLGTISLLSIFIGLRPYISPSSLQISSKGIKYRGPYWPQRKTVNWEQVLRLYVSSELIIVLYRPAPTRKRTWPLVIPSIYLADREQIAQAIAKLSPIEPIVMTSPALVSRVTFAFLFFLLVVWVLEMLIS
jgi:hypothetical protein